MTQNHSAARRFFAKELKRAREEAGKTQAQVAKLLYVTDNLLSQWETARRVPQPDHLAQMEDMYGTKGRLARIKEELVNESGPLEWIGRWLEVEAQSTSLLWFGLAAIPGLLQTEDYARVVLRSGQHHYVDVDELVNTRMQRQQILTREDAPAFIVALMAESVLRHNIGGPKIMHDQLVHLAEMAERDNVIAHIIPTTAKACAGFASEFIIASFNGGREVAYVDNQLSGEVVEDAEDVARLQRLFNTFRSGALPEEESIELIQKAARQWTP